VVEFAYKPDGDVLRDFMKDDSFFRGLRGPVGSGKSVGCAVEIFRRALQQEPDANGMRKTRWAVVRNSYPQLRTTTIKTWLDWFPEDVWGKMLWHPPPYTHRLQRGKLDIEVIFLALDRPEDVKKLLSLELTGVWINEAREVPKAIVDACTMRVGRFPSMKDGGPTWYGVIADTNAPDEDHWWPIMSGEAPLPDHITREEALMLVKPDTWNFFTQPGGMLEEKDREGNLTGYKLNPKAENRKNITPNYYPDIIKGKAKSWIDVYVLNKFGSLSDGKPIYPMFNDEVHLAKEPILPVPGVPIVVGMDFGLTPAAVFCQHVRAKWVILHELVAQDMGIVRFAELFRIEAAQRFPGASLQVYGDPAGDYRAQTDERTPFQILRSAGIKAYPAGNNDVALRLEAVSTALNRLVDGQPGFLVDPRCVNLLKGFRGGYQYRRMQVSGADRYEERPDKNKFSHVHDALQYALIGGGEGRSIMGQTQGGKTVQAKRDFDVFTRKPLSNRQTRVRFGPL
jgi:hypothetical protein